LKIKQAKNKSSLLFFKIAVFSFVDFQSGTLVGLSVIILQKIQEN